MSHSPTPIRNEWTWYSAIVGRCECRSIEQEISRRVVKKHPSQYKDRNRIMPGTVMEYTEKLTKQQIKDGEEPLVKRFVMLRSNGKHEGKPDYYISTSGEKFCASRCNIVAHNSGLVFV